MVNRCKPLPQSVAIEELGKLTKMLSDFLYSNNGSQLVEDVIVNELDLLHIIRKVDQRKQYFSFFHGINISELKEVSLYCFWIIKFKPFSISDKNHVLYDSINENFAFFFIIRAIRLILRKEKKSEEPLNFLTQKYIKEFVYTLKYRDVSKESLIFTVETIATLCGIDAYFENEVTIDPDDCSE